jgi:hypothetical protein
MKNTLKTISLTLAILAAAASVTFGQTNAPASTNTIGGDLEQLFKDDVAFFGSNTVLTIDAGAIYSDHHVGELLNVHTPLPLGTNGQVAIGISALYIDHTLFSGTLNIKAGTTLAVPVVGNVFLWGEVGPGYDFHTHEAITQEFAGVTKGWDIDKGFWLYVSVFSGDISDRSGVAYGATLSGTVKF